MAEFEDKRDDESESNPFFNMARKTLECLDRIKIQMLNYDMMYPYDSVEKQKACIDLIIKFYIFSVPLFPKGPNELEEMEDEVLNLELETRTIVKQGNQITKKVYSKDMEKKLNKILIKLSKILKPYLMPEKRDEEGL